MLWADFAWNQKTSYTFSSGYARLARLDKHFFLVVIFSSCSGRASTSKFIAVCQKTIRYDRGEATPEYLMATKINVHSVYHVTDPVTSPAAICSGALVH